MKYQVQGVVQRVNQGTVKNGPQAGQVWHRVEVAEMGATHSVPVGAADFQHCKPGKQVVISGDTIQRHNARGQYVNEGYELGPGVVTHVDGKPVAGAA